MKLRNKEADAQFKAVYSSYAQPLYKYCLSRLQCNGEDAMDCFQESFTVYYKHLSSGEEIQNPHAYLFKIATNLIKKKYEERTLSLSRTAPEEAVEAVEDTHQLSEVIDKIDYELFEQRLSELLTDEELRLYDLRFKQELKAREIAELLGITVSHCTVKISRLRKKIIQNLSEFR